MSVTEPTNFIEELYCLVNSLADDVLIRELRGRGYHVMRKGAELSIEQVSALVGIAVGTLYNLRSEGLGPKSYRKGHKILYRAEDVELWDRKRKQDVVNETNAIRRPSLKRDLRID